MERLQKVTATEEDPSTQYPNVPMVWLLLPVQAMELLRVILNYAAAEQTTTEPIVQTVADIHLGYMPYSHSIFSALTFSLLAWVILAKGLRKRILGVAVGLGVLSHLILDLLTHAADISLASFIREPKIGLGLYSSLPMLAFILEPYTGLCAGWSFVAVRPLLAIIILFNVANLRSIPAQSTQSRCSLPQLIVTLVAVQIVVTLILGGTYSRRKVVTIQSISN